MQMTLLLRADHIDLRAGIDGKNDDSEMAHTEQLHEWRRRPNLFIPIHECANSLNHGFFRHGQVRERRMLNVSGDLTSLVQTFKHTPT